MNNRQKAHKRLLRYRHAKRLSRNSPRVVFFYRIVRKFHDGLVIEYPVYTARPTRASKGVGVWAEDWKDVAERREKSAADFDRVLHLLGIRP